MLVACLSRFRTRNLTVTQQPEFISYYSSAYSAELKQQFSYSLANDPLLLLDHPEEIYTVLSLPQDQKAEPRAGMWLLRWTLGKYVKRRHFKSRCAGLLGHANEREQENSLEGWFHGVVGQCSAHAAGVRMLKSCRLPPPAACRINGTFALVVM